MEYKAYFDKNCYWSCLIILFQQKTGNVSAICILEDRLSNQYHRQRFDYYYGEQDMETKLSVVLYAAIHWANDSLARESYERYNFYIYKELFEDSDKNTYRIEDVRKKLLFVLTNQNMLGYINMELKGYNTIVYELFNEVKTMSRYFTQDNMEP